MKAEERNEEEHGLDKKSTNKPRNSLLQCGQKWSGRYSLIDQLLPWPWDHFHSVQPNAQVQNSKRRQKAHVRIGSFCDGS